MLEGTIALVAGGARGIGAATAKLLVASGAHVVVADLDNRESAETARLLGPSARAASLDVTDPAGWQACLQATHDAFGVPTILINCAGIYLPGTLEETTVEDFELMFRVNQLGPLLGIQALAPGMAAAGGGAIVNVASTGGVRPAPHSLAYSTTKWGVRGLTQSAAPALAERGIRVNTVVPGLIDTRMAHRNGAAAIASTVSRLGPGRMGTPEEVAAACLHLCLPTSTYTIGTELVVDGGLALA